MKNGLIKIVGVAALLYGVYSAFTIGKTLKELILYFENIGKLSFKDGQMYLYISIGVENPNKQNVTINELKLDIFKDSKQVGRVFKNDANITIKGLTRNTIKNIEVRVDILSLAANYLRLYSGQSSSSDQVFNVTGYLKAGNMKIPVNETIQATQ